uniref:NADH dehydrogenase subunit 6 n=1 Tax=Melampus sincaporensis TaxID=1628046 RepID=UPI00300368D3|nr:NADH dehydrogenase subunit 6 [Melampus sincaporensis]
MTYYLSVVGLFLAGMASVSGSPIGLGGYLITLSFIVSCLIGAASSSWYSLILFLVFVGGVLVLFTYVCMVSSNFVVTNLSSQLAISLVISTLVMTMAAGPLEAGWMGFSLSSDGHEISLVTLLSLVVLLLAAFLGIVRVITSGGSLQIEPAK